MTKLILIDLNTTCLFYVFPWTKDNSLNAFDCHVNKFFYSKKRKWIKASNKFPLSEFQWGLIIVVETILTDEVHKSKLQQHSSDKLFNSTAKLDDKDWYRGSKTTTNTDQHWAPAQWHPQVKPTMLTNRTEWVSVWKVFLNLFWMVNILLSVFFLCCVCCGCYCLAANHSQLAELIVSSNSSQLQKKHIHR